MRKRLLCVSGGASSVCFDRAEGWESVDVGGGLPQPTEALSLGYAISKLRFGFASLAWSCPQYAISDDGFATRFRRHQAALRASPSLAVFHNTPSTMAGLRLDTPSAMVPVAGLFCGFFCGAAGGFFCGGSAC